MEQAFLKNVLLYVSMNLYYFALYSSRDVFAIPYVTNPQ